VTPCLADAAGNDPLEVAQVGLEVDAQPMEADPAAQAHADGGDLVLAQRPVGVRRPVGAGHPDADAARAALPPHAELGQGVDDPVLEGADEPAHVPAAAVQVQHDVGHALPRPVIGVLPAAPRLVDREAVGVAQVLGPRGGAGGVERRVLEEPHGLPGLSARDGFRPRLHALERLGVGDEAPALPHSTLSL
jgi:hypothetical protein